MDQIMDLMDDLNIEVDRLGLVVNLYDPRKGYIATSSLKAWQAVEDPPLVAILRDLKEQREAVRKNLPLLSYAPASEFAGQFRTLATKLDERIVR
jgi:chromosome partitioning protein